jgi:cyclophilin family peptidyl-prolyl cis-trans isomerase
MPALLRQLKGPIPNHAAQGEKERKMDAQEKLFWRMERYAKMWPPDWLERMRDQENPVVFLDVAIRALDRKSTIEHEGRITIELFSHIVPRTAENFRCFCTGEVQDPRRGKAVGYKDVLFHRIIKGYCVQGGDFVKFDGTGCYSIFGGERFADEDLGGKHCAGAVSMANAGVPDSNGCQFFITTAQEAPFFDGKHVVFGQVVDGMDTVGKIQQVPVVGRDYRPLRKVIIEECGQLL